MVFVFTKSLIEKMRLISSLVVVGIVLLLVGANIATTQLQSSMEDKEIRWKKYNARSYGWSMKYPADWEVERNRKEREVVFSDHDGFLSVWASKPFKGKVLLSETADDHEELLRKDKNISEIRRWESSVGDYEAVGFSYKLTFTKESKKIKIPDVDVKELFIFKVKEWIIAKDNRAFWIKCAAYPGSYKEYDSLYFTRMRVTFEII